METLPPSDGGPRGGASFAPRGGVRREGVGRYLGAGGDPALTPRPPLPSPRERGCQARRGTLAQTAPLFARFRLILATLCRVSAPFPARRVMRINLRRESGGRSANGVRRPGSPRARIWKT